MGENEYRTFGVMYVILGIWFCFYFLIYMEAPRALLYAISQPSSSYHSTKLMYIIFPLFYTVSPLALVVFGFVLAVRGEVRVARVSGVLCVSLLIAYFLILFIFIFTV